MDFFVNYEIIPRTISGEKDIDEDNRWCKQSNRTKNYIKRRLKNLGANISVNERCICTGFSGAGSLSWNRNLPEFIKKDYGIDYWPLIWPEHLVNKKEFVLTFANRNTGEDDIFHFKRITKMPPLTTRKIPKGEITASSGKRNKKPKKQAKKSSDKNWKETRKSFPEHKKWISSPSSKA